jgi:uncharacterized membrane protein
MANGRGSGAGGVYAILVVVVILLVVIILFMTGALGGGGQRDTGPSLDVDIQVPETPQAPRPGN